jgi:hypothetical protein
MKFKVLVDFEVDEQKGLNPVILEAGGFHTDSDWIVFRRESRELSATPIAAFPKDRVVSVTSEEV